MSLAPVPTWLGLIRSWDKATRVLKTLTYIALVEQWQLAALIRRRRRSNRTRAPIHLKQTRRSLGQMRGRNLPKGSASTEVSYTTGAWFDTKFWHHMRKQPRGKGASIRSWFKLLHYSLVRIQPFAPSRTCCTRSPEFMVIQAAHMGESRSGNRS